MQREVATAEPVWLTLSSGLSHHVAIRLSKPAATKLANPTSASLTTSQRRLLTLWVQASRKVPVSSSWAMSGAPQNIPMRAGMTRTSAISAVDPRERVATGLLLQTGLCPPDALQAATAES